MRISLRILGPLVVELRSADGGAEPIELDAGPLKQRLLLAILLCRCNAMVPATKLIDVLWWDGPPRTAHKNIQVYISHLRKLVEADGRTGRLRYRPPGYQLMLTPPELDVLRFEDLSRAGRLALRRGDPAAAADVIRQALGLWRGPALADLLTSPGLRAEAARLDDRRLAVYEDWFDAELMLGNHAEVLAEIETVVREHPLRERLRSQQLTALYRGGRQVEALSEYDNLRQLLAAELGLSPSPALMRLYQDILSGSPALSPPGPGIAVMPRPDAEVVAHVAVPRPATPAARQPAAGGTPAGNDPVTTGRPCGLPRAAADFTGRQEVLSRLLAHFGHGTAAGQDAPGGGQDAPGGGQLRRFAAITGPPGAGTTTLALHLAHTIANSFPDGPLLLQLSDGDGAPRPAGELLGELLRKLPHPAGAGPGQLPDGTVADRAGSDYATVLRGRLAGLRMLLIYDDAADEGQIRPLLPGAGECSVIVTSCRHLGGLEGFSHFPIGTFTEEEAVQLLCHIAGQQRIARDPAAALRIVRACGLLPLAVRIAGARLAGVPQLPLARFAARLEDECRLLDELSIGDLSVRDRFGRYLHALSPAERRALMQVAAAWSPPHAERREIEDLLERLACVHALTLTDPAPPPDPSPPPFTMPAPLWVYARQLITGACSDSPP
jgi:DNA-binding SARP family transcriptional activator